MSQLFLQPRHADYLIRDRDACYGNLFVRRVRFLGIRDHPTSVRGVGCDLTRVDNDVAGESAPIQ
jgi:hypothetical protein